MNPKESKALLFVLRHMQEQHATLFQLQAQVAAIGDCLASNQALAAPYAAALQKQVANIHPKLAGLASTYDAIILDTKSSRDLS